MALTHATLIDLNANELILDLDADTSITADSDDTIDFKIGGSDEIKMTTAALSPASSDGNALGTAALEWSDLYLADGALIYFGDDQDTTLTHADGSGLTLNSTNKLMFNDASQFVQGSSATVLSIGATDEIDLTATAIDINGTCDISGTFSLAGTAITTTAAEINLIDGGTARGTTAVASGDGILVNDAGTMRMTNVDTVKTFMQSGLASTLSGQTDVSMDIANFTDGLLIQTNSDGSAPTTGTLSSAVNNIGIGKAVFTALTSGTENVAIGAETLKAQTSGSSNTVVGNEAMETSSTAGNNVAIGCKALRLLTTASYNTAVGSESLKANTTGADNTAIGYQALLANTTGNYNIAIGRNALDANTTAHYNIAVGRSALSANTTGSENIASGYYALHTTTTGNYNTAYGTSALYNSATADNNTAIGRNAMYANTTGSHNVAVGYNALDANTTATSNVAVGQDALSATTTGSDNTAIGRGALATSTTATQNTAIGMSTMEVTTTGSYNTAVGIGSLAQNTTGEANDAFGRRTLYTNTTGDKNVAIGYGALYNNTTADENTAVGYSALYANTTATPGTAVGYQAGAAITTGNYNTAIGANALQNATTGSTYTAVGQSCLNAATTGGSTAAVGFECLRGLTTGTGNVGIGYQAGYYQTALTTGSANIHIGSHSKPSDANGEYQINIGKNITGHGNAKFTFGQGTGSDRVYNSYQSNASWTRVSDERYKENIQTNTDCGLDFINDLRPVTFNWKALSDIDSSLPDYNETLLEPSYGKKMYGLIAQEVKEVIDNHNVTDFGGWDIEENTGIQSVSQEMFIHPLIKAVQELSAKIDAQQSEIDALKNA